MNKIDFIIFSFSCFVGSCFGFYYAMSVEFQKQGSCIKKFGYLLLTDIGATIATTIKLFDFLSNKQKVLMNITIYVFTVLIFWSVIGCRKLKNICDENKNLKSMRTNDISIELCGEKVAITQKKLNELVCMVDKIAEFEDELAKNSEIALNNMKPVGDFISDLCNSVVHKFFNNSEIQIYVKSIDNDIIIEGINTDKIKIDKYFIDYDYGKVLLERGKPLLISTNCGSRLKKRIKSDKEVYIIPIIIAEQPMWYIIIYINNKTKFEDTINALNFMKIEEKISKIVDKYQLDYQMKIESQDIKKDNYTSIQQFMNKNLI